MLRDNLKSAITNSGMIVKEIAAKSGVKKRTIDKWVGAEATEPKINDLYKVCQILGITVEWAVAGESGVEYLRKAIRNDPISIHVPDRIFPIVKGLLLLDDRDLSGVFAHVDALTQDKKGKHYKTVMESSDIAG
jgi:transcriptional regulator with XRE-family HTH domain